MKMKTNSNSGMINRLNTVRMSQQEREIAKAYMQKVEGIIHLIWLAGTTVSSALAWAGGRRKKAAVRLKPASV